MARLNISVPDELKARMDRINDQVNWSSIAQQAFERQLRLHPEYQESKMEAVIERLRASKAEQVDKIREVGEAAGRRWAEEIADYMTLRTIAEDVDVEKTFNLVSSVESIIGVYGKFRIEKTINDRHASRPVGDNNFWKNLGVDSYIDEYFIYGFVLGARSVWNAVRGHLGDMTRPGMG